MVFVVCVRVTVTAQFSTYTNTHEESYDMTIERNSDGSLVVPIPVQRHHDTDEADAPSKGDESDVSEVPTTRVIHPGEGGYNEALAEWDLQQNPDREPVVSTASGAKKR